MVKLLWLLSALLPQLVPNTGIAQSNLATIGAFLPLQGKIICIDPGHGGTALTDAYRVGIGGEREEWINLRVAMLLKEKVEKRGARVVMTRTDDSFIPLADRAKAAKNNHADLFISIHHNATADTTVNFPIIYFHGAASENIASVALGKMVAASLQNNFYKKEVPVSLNSDYTIFPARGASVLRDTYGIPAVLSEASFFTNPGEEQRLTREDYNAAEANAYMLAIESFFQTAVPPIKPLKIPESIAPFKVLEEADRMDKAALDWQRDFNQGLQLMSSSDTATLRRALELFTRSARSFPDSWLAGKCHFYMAELLSKLNEPDAARDERIRFNEFYVNLN